MARFSSRIRWNLEPTPLAEAVAAQRPSLLDLTQSNPTDAGIVADPAILNTLADRRSLTYEPDSKGLLAARREVSAYYGGHIDPEHILLTASTSEAYSWVFKLLCDPGDEVLVPRPSYPLFEFLGHLEGIQVRQYPMHEHGGWFIDLDALQQMVTPRTKAIVFVNPNNPTGSYLKSAEYDFLGQLGIPLVVDEVFLDYSFGPRVESCSLKHDVLTFTLSGLSKISGLPQMKLGWIVVSGPEADRNEALSRLDLIADTFLSVGTPVQHALPQFLNARHEVQMQIRTRTARNLECLRELVKGSPARLIEPEAGWYATLQVPRVRTEEEWVLRLIREYETLVQPSYFYDFESEAFLILSLLTEPDVFSEGSRRTILATDG